MKRWLVILTTIAVAFAFGLGLGEVRADEEPRTRLWCMGDSLTAADGGWCYKLQNTYVVNNVAQAGATLLGYDIPDHMHCKTVLNYKVKVVYWLGTNDGWWRVPDSYSAIEEKFLADMEQLQEKGCDVLVILPIGDDIIREMITSNSPYLVIDLPFPEGKRWTHDTLHQTDELHAWHGFFIALELGAFE